MGSIGDQYGVSEAEAARLRREAVRRAELRAQHQRLVSNPHSHAKGQGGYVFDPALQRYQSMWASQYDFFKQTPKTARRVILYFMPMFVMGYFVKLQRDTKENKIRTGQIAYRDRDFKFV